MPSSPGSVGLARAHPLTKTQAMEPSRQTRSYYGPPYLWGVGRRWIVPEMVATPASVGVPKPLNDEHCASMCRSNIIPGKVFCTEM